MSEPEANVLIHQAMQQLPHGPEFRFVDEIVTLDPGQSGSGIYRLPADAVFLRGHFPGQPLLPGVLMIEAIAQVAGVVTQCDPAIAPLLNLRLTGVRGAKFFGTIEPGASIHIEITVIARMGNLIQARGSVSSNGARLAEAEVTLAGTA